MTDDRGVQTDGAASGMTARRRHAWRRLRDALLLAACILLLLPPAAVRAYQEIDGRFLADAPCPALASIRKGSNPGAIHLVQGRTYTAYALNKPNGSHVHVGVPGAEPGRRWVALTCGRLDGVSEGGVSEGGGQAQAPLPFFDDKTPARASAAADPSPPAPSLTALDEAVLRLCGDWGHRPERAAFRRMLDDPGLQQEVARLRHDLQVPPGTGPSDFADAFTQAWFGAGGFAHIFCGEPAGDTIGGLHYAPRYLQMQQRGWGGLEPACDRTEIVPPVYTIGVRYRRPGGGQGSACPKGYARDLDAHGLFVAAGRALRAVGNRPGKTVCLHRVAPPDGDGYMAVFVARDGAIRTFYPDASPACDGGAPADRCLCAGP